MKNKLLIGGGVAVALVGLGFVFRSRLKNSIDFVVEPLKAATGNSAESDKPQPTVEEIIEDSINPN